MHRSLALLFAVLLTAISVGSAGFAADPFALTFNLRADNSLHSAELSVRTHGSDNDNFTSHYRLDELRGLAPSLISGAVMTPARFNLQRDAGRLDCEGVVGRSVGRGGCTVWGDPGFAAMLDQRGIGRPDQRQTFLLTMTGASRAQVEALDASRFPRPTVNQLVALGIFNIGPADIRGFADIGYRPASLDDLVAFKIHGVTPAFISSFERIGYRNLPANKLAELRIFGVTPSDVQRVQARDGGLPDLGRVVQSRILGRAWARR